MSLEEIYQLIIMYSPTLVTVAGYISTFVILLKKLESFSFKKDTEALESKVNKMLEANSNLSYENKQLKKQLSLIIDKNMKIQGYEEIIENDKKL